jgi:hypothetical protein
MDINKYETDLLKLLNNKSSEQLMIFCIVLSYRLFKMVEPIFLKKKKTVYDLNDTLYNTLYKVYVIQEWFNKDSNVALIIQNYLESKLPPLDTHCNYYDEYLSFYFESLSSLIEFSKNNDLDYVLSIAHQSINLIDYFTSDAIEKTFEEIKSSSISKQNTKEELQLLLDINFEQNIMKKEYNLHYEILNRIDEILIIDNINDNWFTKIFINLNRAKKYSITSFKKYNDHCIVIMKNFVEKKPLGG